MAESRFELPLRVVLEDPAPGVAIMLFSGGPRDGRLHAPANASPSALVFEFEVTVDGQVSGGAPRLLGPFTQGPPAARFVYLNVGRYAGQSTSEWAGRVKIPLFGITRPDIDALKPGQRLTAHIAGRDKKGRPALASAPILPPGWRTT